MAADMNEAGPGKRTSLNLTLSVWEPVRCLKDMEEDRAAEARGRELASVRGHRILFGPLDSSITLCDLPLHPTCHPLCSHSSVCVSLTPPGDLSPPGPSSSLVRPVEFPQGWIWPVQFALLSFLIYPLSSVAGKEGTLGGESMVGDRAELGSGVAGNHSDVIRHFATFSGSIRSRGDTALVC